jgi:hypothetical protein
VVVPATAIVAVSVIAIVMLTVLPRGRTAHARAGWVEPSSSSLTRAHEEISPDPTHGARRANWPRSLELILIHLPIHASWLNQAEIYFSIVQRQDLAAVWQRLLAFRAPLRADRLTFERTFTRSDLERLLKRLAEHEPTLSLAA